MSSPESWGEWLAGGPVWGGIGAVLMWLGNLLWQRRVHSDALEEKKHAREDLASEHATRLAVELLNLTNAELRTARVQINELSSDVARFQEIDRRLAHFEEALLHIDALLNARATGDREAAEHNARLFMTRMIALREGKGIGANREQAVRAAAKLIENGGEQ